jgi:hypothetical protein
MSYGVKQQHDFDENKLAELIVFFAKENADDRHFGATKLNKLLFTADFMAYAYLGKPITGATYIRQQFGPTPEPRQFLPVREKLEKEGRIKIAAEETYSGPQQRPRALSEPNLNFFTEKELAICRDVIDLLRPLRNVESSDWSHEFPGWLYARNGEVIPYETVYLWRKEPATLEDREWAESIAQKRGLLKNA